MFKKLFSVMLVAGFAATLVTLGSALYTGTQEVDANAFTTGDVDISTDETTAFVTFSDMVPGDEVTAPIVVSNSGTLALRYALTSIATNVDTKGLMSQLDLTIKTGVTACTDAGFATDGTMVYATGNLGGATAINLIGDPTTGDDEGDRTLAASAEETLCFNVSLPVTTSDTYENSATDATFAFEAEQTVNND